MKPVVAIIGRPNVGKSTLFNAMARKNIAIVHDLPGVTRDRNYADVKWDESTFTLVDTGGFGLDTKDDLSDLVQVHAQIAVEEADLIIFLMDGREGLLNGDLEIAQILRKAMKPVLYAVNKVENRKIEENITDFYRLGADTIIPVSAKNKLRISDLLDEVCKLIPRYQGKEFSKDETVVSIIGRPNVGKSSLINKILGYERLMVCHEAGTTRDPVDSLIQYNKKIIRFIDTAGIRRKSRIGYNLEKYCVFRAMKSINRSSVCILMVDASEGVASQDAKLAAQINDRNRVCILVINKWDLIEKDGKKHDEFIKQVRSDLAFIDFAPIVAVSALTGQRVRKILDIIDEIGSIYEKRVPTSEFNRELKAIYDRKPPPRGRRGMTKIYYAAQVGAGPPTFKLFTNNPEAFRPNYIRYLERAIRERFGFDGCPICLQIAERGRE
jgi:GTP-binding protein